MKNRYYRYIAAVGASVLAIINFKKALYYSGGHFTAPMAGAMCFTTALILLVAIVIRKTKERITEYRYQTAESSPSRLQRRSS